MDPRTLRNPRTIPLSGVERRRRIHEGTLSHARRHTHDRVLGILPSWKDRRLVWDRGCASVPRELVLCGTIAAEERGAGYDSEEEPEIRYYCSLCNKKLATRRAATNAETTNTHRNNLGLPALPKPFYCAVCGKSYVTKLYMSYHEKSDGHRKRLGLPLLPKSFRCDDCDHTYEVRQRTST